MAGGKIVVSKRASFGEGGERMSETDEAEGEARFEVEAMGSVNGTRRGEEGRSVALDSGPASAIISKPLVLGTTTESVRGLPVAETVD